MMILTKSTMLSFQMSGHGGMKEKVTKARGVKQEIWVDCLFQWFLQIRNGHSREYTSQSTGIRKEIISICIYICIYKFVFVSVYIHIYFNIYIYTEQ